MSTDDMIIQKLKDAVKDNKSLASFSVQEFCEENHIPHEYVSYSTYTGELLRWLFQHGAFNDNPSTMKLPLDANQNPVHVGDILTDKDGCDIATVVTIVDDKSVVVITPCSDIYDVYETKAYMVMKNMTNLQIFDKLFDIAYKMHDGELKTTLKQCAISLKNNLKKEEG